MAGPGGTPYNGPMSLPRPDVMRGPRFTSAGPGPEPRPLIHQISLWAGHSVVGECRADVRWVRARLFNRRPQAGIDGPESGRMRNAMAARRAARVGIGTQYNARYAG
jgi:hypothetical protein